MWKPELTDGPAPIYERLADALQRDIGAGVLSPGTRLPTHRALAQTLDLSVGTIAKAYREAETRGCILSHVGRGSFVPRQSPPRKKVPERKLLNLARNSGPARIDDSLLRSSLTAMAARPDLLALLGDHADPFGRDTGLIWLRQMHQLRSVAAAQIIRCNGSMHALSTILRAHRSSTDTVLCDPLTFSGLPIAARSAGLRLRPVAGDAFGMSPAALDAQLAASEARLIYLIPTLHNPTTRTLDATRRAELVEVARRHDALIIEDEVYRPLALQAAGQPALPALRDLAPERTYYIASASKVLCHGLRLAYVLSPGNAPDQLRQLVLSEAGFAPPAFGSYLLARWIEDGTAERLLTQNLRQAASRMALARQILTPALPPDAALQGGAGGLHLWLPMASAEARRLSHEALRLGVELLPVDAMMAVPQEQSGLRICLGAADSDDELTTALTLLAGVLTRASDPAPML